MLNKYVHFKKIHNYIATPNRRSKIRFMMASFKNQSYSPR